MLIFQSGCKLVFFLKLSRDRGLKIMKLFKKFLIEFEGDIQNDAKNNESCDGKVESKIFFFNADVTREFANPLEFVSAEVENETYDYE